MTGVFPDYPAPVVRNGDAGRELTMMRWGMLPPPRAGRFPVTNIRNTTSLHWRGWLKAGKPLPCTRQQLCRIRAGAESIARTSSGLLTPL
jgi:putative SOS response-associated peptidase YedK